MTARLASKPLLAATLACVIQQVAQAAGPQAKPQVYMLSGREPEQIVMLSNWASGTKFTAFETGDPHFKSGQDVWISCDKTVSKNKVAKIENSRTIWLASAPKCSTTPWLMSNRPFDDPRWRVTAATKAEEKRIRAAVGGDSAPRVTKIETDKKGTFYLVLDKRMKSIYETGGQLLLNDKFETISKFENAPLVPLIDLNGDTVPEFFFASTDGLDAWLYEMYPRQAQAPQK